MNAKRWLLLLSVMLLGCGEPIDVKVTVTDIPAGTTALKVTAKLGEKSEDVKFSATELGLSPTSTSLQSATFTLRLRSGGEGMLDVDVAAMQAEGCVMSSQAMPINLQDEKEKRIVLLPKQHRVVVDKSADATINWVVNGGIDQSCAGQSDCQIKACSRVRFTGNDPWCSALTSDEVFIDKDLENPIKIKPDQSACSPLTVKIALPSGSTAVATVRLTIGTQQGPTKTINGQETIHIGKGKIVNLTTLQENTLIFTMWSDAIGSSSRTWNSTPVLTAFFAEKTSPPIMGMPAIRAVWMKTPTAPKILNEVLAVGDKVGLKWNGTWVLIHPESKLYSIWAGNEIWATGENKIVRLNIDNYKWEPHNFTKKEGCGIDNSLQLHGIYLIDNITALSVGSHPTDGGCIILYDNGWKSVHKQNGWELRSVWAASASDAWAVGRKKTRGITYHDAAILQRKDATWLDVPLPMETQDKPLRGVWGFGVEDVWTVGEKGLVLHWNGTSWSLVTDTKIPASNLNSVWGNSSSDLWIVGEGGVVLHRNNTGWRQLPSNTDKNLNGVFGIGDDVWIVGDGGTALHYVTPM